MCPSVTFPASSKVPSLLSPQAFRHHHLVLTAARSISHKKLSSVTSSLMGLFCLSSAMGTFKQGLLLVPPSKYRPCAFPLLLSNYLSMVCSSACLCHEAWSGTCWRGHAPLFFVHRIRSSGPNATRKSRVISKLSQLDAMLGATFNKFGTMPL